MPGFDLGTKAREFASEIQDVLNGTVCHGVPIAAVAASRGIYKVGYQLRSDEYRVSPIPLSIGKQPSGYLGIQYSLAADDEVKYLMVTSSVLSYAHDTDLEHPFLHYDYERDKEHDYPDSHLQIGAESEAWEAIQTRCGLNKSLSSLHLPLGGRRFRPTLENLIAFLIAEKLADGRETWREALAAGQDRFDRLQVAAAVRRNPEVARDALAELERAKAADNAPSASQAGKHRARS